ncbi:hypothetical protein OC846_001995 [Tilletia horrida]|uniref:PITH domain-containing protein n=1 Tax=Tilletia horrida TaxID=155126 RepID=A0AAN6GUY3_9BASI|nr:hypothetical protein OC845_003613 [Tilletia horrida]KAK0554661.1 hypothetical protein OC846_001995 [Tilletia horrida]KAK0569835.1 hypothetical protein OC861_000546 [Tilletia horrida]
MNCNEEVTTVDLNQTGSQAGDEANLYEFIDRDKVWGLNLSVPESARAVVKPWNERHSLEVSVESLVDDQFIINVPFICPCRIKSILLNPGRGDMAPQRCRIFVNRPQGISFDEVEANSLPDAPSLPTYTTQSVDSLSRSLASLSSPGSASQEAESSTSASSQGIPVEQQHYVSSTSNTNQPGAVGSVGSGKPQADFALLEASGPASGGVVSEYPVSLARFANVNSVSVVLSDTSGMETGQLFYLGFRGKALALKKKEEADFDVPAANAADAPIDGVRENAGPGSIRQDMAR